jgi:hypothetical protein
MLTTRNRATIIVLHRPRIDFRSPPDSFKQDPEQTIMRKARSAAARTNRVLEKVIELDMVHYLKPMR